VKCTTTGVSVSMTAGETVSESTTGGTRSVDQQSLTWVGR
jgi:hypothetical protein